MSRRRTRWIAVGAIVAGVALIAGGAVFALTAVPRGAPQARASGSAAPHRERPLTPAEALLARSHDPSACALSFQLEGAAVEPMLQTQGLLYRDLPIPQRAGMEFGGWYSSPGAASAYTTADRLNGSKPVACTDRQLTVFGAWMAPAQAAAAHTRVPILMYHQFTTKPQGEKGWLRANYLYTGAFTEQMAYIATHGYYLPTWDELEAFIDGRLYLPTHSVIVTDDDADPTWTNLAAPIVAAQHVLTTSFVIGRYSPGGPPNMYVIQRSHTYDMHTAGANGKGRMVNYTVPQIVADMDHSAQVVGGVKQVMAYPYGQYDANALEGLREAGFDMAVTTQWGYVVPGATKLELPRVRVSYGETLAGFIASLG